ncbi:MAG: hypothetical protein DRP15_00440 [Candidatus Aenigmatarchaeota archaeon]|nr:MAG: hypothetical protein DRP15_00440 [Candidatus Aenigmarchaeota archaeon]
MPVYHINLEDIGSIEKLLEKLTDAVEKGYPVALGDREGERFYQWGDGILKMSPEGETFIPLGDEERVPVYRLQ